MKYMLIDDIYEVLKKHCPNKMTASEISSEICQLRGKDIGALRIHETILFHRKKRNIEWSSSGKPFQITYFLKPIEKIELISVNIDVKSL